MSPFLSLSATSALGKLTMRLSFDLKLIFSTAPTVNMTIRWVLYLKWKRMHAHLICKEVYLFLKKNVCILYIQIRLSYDMQPISAGMAVGFIILVAYFLCCVWNFFNTLSDSWPAVWRAFEFPWADIQRRGSILVWIVILSVYGADTIAEVKLLISPFLRWSIDIWNWLLCF